MITQAQKEVLQAAGYTVEDMGAVWGSDFAGQYRWMNETHEPGGGDGFGVIQYDLEAAWDDALQFQEQALGIPVLVPEQDCINGIHSWASEVGRLPPKTKCAYCSELYGRPD